MTKIRMGIIGCGGMAAAHFSGYKELGDHTEVTAVCDIEPDRAQSAASQLGITPCRMRGETPRARLLPPRPRAEQPA